MNDLETVEGRILETLGSRMRWWTVGEIKERVGAEYLEVSATLEHLLTEDRVQKEQFAPQMKPRWGIKGVAR